MSNPANLVSPEEGQSNFLAKIRNQPKCKILIVDDELGVRMIIKASLGHQLDGLGITEDKYEFVESRTYEEAEKQLEEMGKNVPDVVFADGEIKLGKMTGPEFIATKLRGNILYGSTEIYGMSGGSHNAEFKELLARGAIDDFGSKEAAKTAEFADLLQKAAKHIAELVPNLQAYRSGH
jgi:CheY-like chemotaxis protein